MQICDLAIEMCVYYKEVLLCFHLQWGYSANGFFLAIEMHQLKWSVAERLGINTANKSGHCWSCVMHIHVLTATGGTTEV